MMPKARIAVVAAFVLAAAGAVTAQTGKGNPPAAKAWFGQPLPGPANDGVTPAFDTVHTDIPAVAATFAPGPKDPELQGQRIKTDLRTIVEFSLKSKAKGDFLWGRISGTPEYYETAQWAVEQMKKAGLKDAHIEDFTANLTIPVAGEVRLVGSPDFGAGSEDIVLRSTMVGGRNAVNGRVTAPLIYVGHATDADLIGRDVTGKIAVVHSTPNPGVYSTNENGRLAALIEKGAAAVVEILEQPANMQSFDGDRHGCSPNLCFTVGGEDGFFLENVIGKAGVAGKSITARVAANSEERTGVRTANGVATIPGKTARTILVNAHADAFFTGADDNGGGVATLLALARHFAKMPQPEHTLVFIISAGHHSPGNGLNQFRKVHDADFVANADLVINLEHVGVSGMVRSAVERQTNNFGLKPLAATVENPKQVGVSNRAPFLIDLWRQGAACFGLSLQRVVDPSNPGELGAFRDAPFPVTQMISAGSTYHTSGETVNSVPDEALERAARFHAFFIAEADKASTPLLRGGAWTSRAGCPATP
jgi:peptidase M28-like protein